MAFLTVEASPVLNQGRSNEPPFGGQYSETGLAGGESSRSWGIFSPMTPEHPTFSRTPRADECGCQLVCGGIE